MDDRPTQFPFQQVDVFTSVPFKGNPVAVVFDADGLTAAQMQSIASWTNLSETTFVCSPLHEDADYRLRIFTPRSELPFAGHPTLGSAWAVLGRGLRPKTQGTLVQEYAKGLVALRQVDNSLFFALPGPDLTEVDTGQLIAVSQALGVASEAVLASAVVDVGAVWLTVQLYRPPFWVFSLLACESECLPLLVHIFSSRPVAEPGPMSTVGCWLLPLRLGRRGSLSALNMCAQAPRRRQ